MSAVALAGLFALLVMFMHVQFDLGIERWTWCFKYVWIWIAWTTMISVGYELWHTPL